MDDLTTRYSLDRRTCGCTMHVSATGKFVLAADYDALITRLRAAEARTAWQPIETAPAPEGTAVLAWAHGYSVAEGYHVGGLWYGEWHGVTPTHWMPLPEVPQ